MIVLQLMRSTGYLSGSLAMCRYTCRNVSSAIGEDMLHLNCTYARTRARAHTHTTLTHTRTHTHTHTHTHRHTHTLTHTHSHTQHTHTHTEHTHSHTHKHTQSGHKQSSVISTRPPHSPHHPLSLFRPHPFSPIPTLGSFRHGSVTCKRSDEPPRRLGNTLVTRRKMAVRACRLPISHFPELA